MKKDYNNLTTRKQFIEELKKRDSIIEYLEDKIKELQEKLITSEKTNDSAIKNTTKNTEEHKITQYLTKKQAAEFLTNELGLPTSDKTLSKYICVGGSPIYQKFGERVLYTKENLIKWAKSKTKSCK